MVEAKKHILTSQGMQALEDELQDLKVVKRKEIAQKIKEAREQGDLSENAEYDAAKESKNLRRSSRTLKLLMSPLTIKIQ